MGTIVFATAIANAGGTLTVTAPDVIVPIGTCKTNTNLTIDLTVQTVTDATTEADTDSSVMGTIAITTAVSITATAVATIADGTRIAFTDVRQTVIFPMPNLTLFLNLKRILATPDLASLTIRARGRAMANGRKCGGKTTVMVGPTRMKAAQTRLPTALKLLRGRRREKKVRPNTWL
ncbi:MAG: hypothetical protein II655_03100 [Thermoguttaceae bacterium]|nr:hypothetical protein [Thermoguttaceae bacterium]